MNSNLFQIFFAIIFSLVIYIKLRNLDKSQFHCFDVNATLPLRGLLAILIVCHHIGQHFSNIQTGIGTILVSMFFFISGYGLMVSYCKKTKKISK
jgi:membrane-bound acyltransferase YfiQ involved in biofilm formation